MSGSTLNAVPFRSTIFYTAAGTLAAPGTVFTVDANGIQSTTNSLTLNTLSVSTLSFQSTTISLGQSTNQAYNNFTNGSFSSTLMTSTLTTYNSLSTVTKVSMSQDGRLQYALQSVPSTSNYYQLARSSDTGVTWNTLNTSTMGLPQGSLAYQSTVSGFPTYSNFSQSATGQYALASTRGGQLYVSNNANSATPVYTPANVGGSPTVYLPFDALPITDMMGNTTITVTGSAPLVAGKVGTSAINLVNTAGGTATNYVTGTWTGATNFTVSFWFNTPNSNTNQILVGAYNGQFNIVTSSSVLYLFIPSSLTTAVLAVTGPTILNNTWYNVTVIFQTGSACSLYVNGTFYGSYTNSGALPPCTQFCLGTYGNGAVSNAFNGYIDDFRIYNFAAPNVIPPYIYLPLDGNVVDAMGNSTTSSSAKLAYTNGIVGSQALYLNNTINGAGGTATAYYRGTMPSNLTNYTVSGWFNPQSMTSTGNQFIFSTGGQTGAGAVILYISTNNKLALQVPNGVGFVSSNTSLVTGRWYYFMFTVNQSGGTCTLYFDNLITTATAAASTGSGTFGLGTFDSGTATSAFNGYIDDFRIYNYAVTFSPIVPMNWSHTAVSGTGQYMMAAAANGGIFYSSNYGATWSQVTSSQISSLVPTGNAITTQVGPVISPNTPVTTSATWSINGVTWTATASTTYAGSNPYMLFDTISANNNNWASNQTYNTTSGAYTGSVSTTVLGGVGAVTGEWFQIRTSIPLVMYTYSYSSTNYSCVAKTYYIVGSLDEINWYPIQSASFGATNPFTTIHQLASTYVIVNSASAQSFTAIGGTSGTLTTVTYPTTTNAYTYFRIIGTSLWPSSFGLFEYDDFPINFYTPLQLLSTSSAAPTSYTSPITVSPTMSGIAASTWTTPNGVTWSSSASSNYSTNLVYYPFNEASGATTAVDSMNGYNATVNGTVTFGTAGKSATCAYLNGGYLSLSSSLYSMWNNLTSGTISCWVYPTANSSLTGSILFVKQRSGSNTYSMLSIGSYNNAAAFTAATAGKVYFALSNTYYSSTCASATVLALNTWYHIAGTFTSSAVTFYINGVQDSTYSLAWNLPNDTAASGMYIGTNLVPAQQGIFYGYIDDFSLWNYNLSLSSIQTMFNGGNSVPSLAPLIGSNALYNPLSFNWASSNTTTYDSSGNYVVGGSSSTTTQNAGTVRGEYFQLNSSVPLVAYSFTYSALNGGCTAKSYFLLGSNDGTTWFAIQSASYGATNPCTDSTLTTSIIINNASAQTVISGATGTLTTTTYTTTTNAYSYFRFVGTTIWSGAAALFLQYSKFYINFTAYTPNPVNALAITNGGQMMMAATTGTTSPNSSAATSNSWTANGVNWTASASSTYGANWPAYAAFNGIDSTSVYPYAWASTGDFLYNPQYPGSKSTVIVGVNSGNAVLGEWLQIQSSAPLVMYNYSFASGGASSNLPQVYYIVGSNDGVTWYPIQYASMSSIIPQSIAWRPYSSYIMVNQSGTQVVQGNQLSSGTFTTYATTTSAFTYFRIIATTTYRSSAVFELEEWYINFQAGSTYLSTNYGSNWSTAITAPANAPFLATSGNGIYTITGTGQLATLYSNSTISLTTPTFPTLTGINANINCASISSTGQYMVILTQGTTNNVFYSTNYGATFTAMTVGNAAMTSCAISSDGNELTVSNAANVYTLNRNTQGFSITMGNQSGLTNQGQNAIAIGNLAGVTNQSANSIILNSSGTILDAYNPGFFVSPVLPQATSNQSTFQLLGYGADSQIVYMSPSVNADGSFNPFVIISSNTGTTAGTTLQLSNRGGSQIQFINSLGQGYYNSIVQAGDFGIINRDYLNYNANGVPFSNPALATGGICIASHTTASAGLRVSPTGVQLNGIINMNGNVGIGTTVPSTGLHVNSATAFSGIQLTNTYNSTTGSLGFYIVPSAGGNFINNSTGNAGVILPSDGKDLYIGRTTANNTSLVVQGGTGYVGIGLTNPTVPLYVNGYSGSVAGAVYYINGANGNTIQYGSLTNISIFSSNGIQAGDYIGARSDQRIKKNIKPLTNPLEKLSQIEVVSYDKIDFTAKGSDCGVIAQNIKEILPRAVTTMTDYLPNIYAIGTHIKDDNTIRVTVVFTENTIKVNVKVKLYVVREEANNEVQTPYEVVVIDYDDASITVAPWDKYDASDRVFVYGVEHDDIMSVEKDQIGILAAAGVKELHAMNLTQADKITALEASNVALSSQIEVLMARLNAAGI